MEESRLPIYLLLDCSEEMRGEPMRAAREVAGDLLEQLAGDRSVASLASVCVISYADEAEEAVPAAPLPDFRMPDPAIGGSPALGNALETLMRIAGEASGGAKPATRPIAVIFTSGHISDPETYAQAVRGMRSAGFAHVVACVAAEGADMAALRRLTSSIEQLPGSAGGSSAASRDADSGALLEDWSCLFQDGPDMSAEGEAPPTPGVSLEKEPSAPASEAGAVSLKKEKTADTAAGEPDRVSLAKAAPEPSCHESEGTRPAASQEDWDALFFDEGNVTTEESSPLEPTVSLDKAVSEPSDSRVHVGGEQLASDVAASVSLDNAAPPQGAPAAAPSVAQPVRPAGASFSQSMARRLPVYILADCSRSMRGAHITALQNAVGNLVDTLRSDPQALESAWLSVIEFSDGATQTVPLTDLAHFEPPVFHAEGTTATGAALELLMDRVQNEVRKSTETRKGDWRPLVFILTDGAPTDWDRFRTVAQKMRSGGFASVIACAAGAPTAEYMKQVTDNVLLLEHLTPEALGAFFSWVSDSIRVSSRQVADTSGQAFTLPAPPAGFTTVP